MITNTGRKRISLAGLLVFVLGCCAVRTAAQTPSGQGQTGPAKPATDKDKAKIPAVVLRDAPAASAPAADAEETAAIQGFINAPVSDLAGKIHLGEAFVLKYPHNLGDMERAYSTLTFCYLLSGEPKKVREAGEKAIAINDKDVNVLAIMAMTMPRAVDASDPDPQKTLATAEGYAKHAIELVPALPKPVGVTDEVFETTKNQALSMAHDGLGMVSFRRGKYADAIPEFEQSVKIAPQPDPVTLYLLGIADQQESHFDDAASAYTKCMAIPGGMQSRCKAGLEQAKKSAATQLSAPK